MCVGSTESHGQARVEEAEYNREASKIAIIRLSNRSAFHVDQQIRSITFDYTTKRDSRVEGPGELEAYVSDIEVWNQGKRQVGDRWSEALPRMKGLERRQALSNEYTIAVPNSDLRRILISHKPVRIIRPIGPPYAEDPENDLSLHFNAIFEDSTSRNKFLNDIRKHPQVESASKPEPFGVISDEAIDDIPPNDLSPGSYDQWGLEAGIQFGNELEVAWSVLKDAGISPESGSTIFIEALDTGYSISSLRGSDIDDNLSSEQSITGFYDNHILQTSSMLAASTNNNTAISGASYNSPTKVLMTSNTVESDRTPVQQVCDAINGSQFVDVINLSFTVGNDYNCLDAAIGLAVSNDIIVVASAGNAPAGNNGYCRKGECYWPAAYNDVVSVQGHDFSGQHVSGPNGPLVDFSAPGREVTLLESTSSSSLLQQINDRAGSSFAAPHVSSIVVLMKAVANHHNHRLDHTDVYSILEESSRPVPANGHGAGVPKAGYAILRTLLEVGAFFEIPFADTEVNTNITDDFIVPSDVSVTFNNNINIINNATLYVYGNVTGSGTLNCDEGSTVEVRFEGSVSLSGSGNCLTQGGGNEDYIVPQTITSDVVLSGSSPFLIDSPVTVSNGATLTIKEGVTVNVDALDKVLVIEPGSQLRVEGVPGATVRFVPKDFPGVYGERWGGIEIRGSGSFVQYARFGRGGVGQRNGDGTRQQIPMVHVQAENVSLFETSFVDGFGSGLRVTAIDHSTNSTVAISESHFIDNDGFGIFTQGANISMAGNTVQGNSYSGVFISSSEGSMTNNNINYNDLEGVNIYSSYIDKFEGNVIRNNGQYGLDVGIGSLVYLDGNSRNRIYNNLGHEIQGDSGYELFLGDTSIDSGGYNEIYNNTEEYGSSYLYVNNLGSAVIKAEMNDWGGSPATNMFSGNVDYLPAISPLSVSLSCIPNNLQRNESVCYANATGGEGGYSYNWNASSCTNESSCTTTCGNSISVVVNSANGESASTSSYTGACPAEFCDSGSSCFLQPLASYTTVDMESLDSSVSSLEDRITQDLEETLSDNYLGRNTENIVSQNIDRIYKLLILKDRIRLLKSTTGESNRSTFNTSDLHSSLDSVIGHLVVDPKYPASMRRAATEALADANIRATRPQSTLSLLKRQAADSLHFFDRAHAHLLRAEAFRQLGLFDKALASVKSAESVSTSRDFTALRVSLLQQSGDPGWFNAADSKLGSGTHLNSRNRDQAKSDSIVQGDQDANSLHSKTEIGGVHPNPSSTTALIPLFLPEQSNITVTVYDLLGRKIKKTTSRRLASGNRSVRLDTSTLSSGVYFVRILIENKKEKINHTEKVTVAR